MREMKMRSISVYQCRNKNNRIYSFLVDQKKKGNIMVAEKIQTLAK